MGFVRQIALLYMALVLTDPQRDPGRIVHLCQMCVYVTSFLFVCALLSLDEELAALLRRHYDHSCKAHVGGRRITICGDGDTLEISFSGHKNCDLKATTGSREK